MKTLFEIASRLQSAGALESMILVVIKATLILLIGRLLVAAMPRASAATKHLIATATLIAIAILPIATAIVPAWEIVVERPAAAAPAPETAAKTIGATDQEGDSAITLGAAVSIARASGILPEKPLGAMTHAMNVVRATWKGLIVLSVGSVALLMLGHALIGILGVRFVERNTEEFASDEALRELDRVRDQLALNTDVRLLRSSRISVPVIWGVRRPVLLLPADVVTWPAERLRVVLLHELSHVKRYDCISLLATRAAVALFWFHPLAWSMERLGRSECERACDDLALAAGTTKASDYADHLLAIAKSIPTFDPFRSVTLAMSRRSQLEGRLLSILQPHVVRGALGRRGVAMAIVAAAIVILPVSAFRLTAQPAKPSDVVTAENKNIRKSDSTVTVTPEVGAIQDFLLTKLGKYGKHADKFASQPRNGQEWYERAYDYYHNDRYEEAGAAFQRAAGEGYRKATSLYNAACSYSLNDDADRALKALGDAIAAGWDDVDHIARDDDFDPIRTDPRFATLVEKSLGESATRRVTEIRERFVHLSTKKDKADADDWFEVGGDLLRLRQLDDAIAAYKNAIARSEKVSSAMYNIACAYSLKGDTANGMQWLEKAVDNGFSSDEKFAHDPDIALLRKQPGFAALRQRAKDLELRGCCDFGKLARGFFDNWRSAADHHREMVRKYPSSGRAWFNLGYTALQARDYPTSLEAFRRSVDLGYRPGTSSYNMACAHALAGDTDAAFDWLRRAQAAGFALENYIFHDDDLDKLHDDPRWDTLRAEMKAKKKHKEDRHEDSD